jgi:DNA-binding protein Alba
MVVVMMITIIVRENTILAPSSSRPQVLPLVLLIGKKYAVEYIAPALSRLNTTSEPVIKATGSLGIVTAADVAKLVMRDMGDLVTRSIIVGTDELTTVVGGSGISKRMSCIRFFCCYSSFITITIFFLLFRVYDVIFSRLWCDPRHSSRKQHRVLDVVDVCYPAHQALDAKPKAAVRHRAELAEVKVPVVGSRVKPFLLDALSH